MFVLCYLWKGTFFLFLPGGCVASVGSEVLLTSLPAVYVTRLYKDRSLVSPRKEFVHTSVAPVFVATTQKTPLDCLALAASRAYVCGAHRTVTNGESS